MHQPRSQAQGVWREKSHTPKSLGGGHTNFSRAEVGGVMGGGKIFSLHTHAPPIIFLPPITPPTSARVWPAPAPWPQDRNEVISMHN